MRRFALCSAENERHGGGSILRQADALTESFYGESSVGFICGVYLGKDIARADTVSPAAFQNDSGAVVYAVSRSPSACAEQKRGATDALTVRAADEAVAPCGETEHVLGCRKKPPLSNTEISPPCAEIQRRNMAYALPSERVPSARR